MRLSLLGGRTLLEDDDLRYLVDLDTLHVAAASARSPVEALAATLPPALPAAPTVSPWGLILTLTHRCNLQCTYCFSDVGASVSSLDLAAVTAALDHALRHPPHPTPGVFGLSFFGGEPTLQMPLVRQVVAMARERTQALGAACGLAIVTNGTASPSIMDELVDEGFRIVLSMDGPPSLQATQRPGPPRSGEWTERSLRQLAARRAAFRVRATISRETAPHLDEIIDYFADLGAPWLHFEPVGPASDHRALPMAHASPDARDYVQAVTRAMDRARTRRLPLWTYAWQHLVRQGRSYCSALDGEQGFYTVNADGRVVMCPEIQDPARIARFGQQVGTAPGAIDEDRRRRIGEEARAAMEHPDCQVCPVQRLCRSGCPSRNLQATGSLRRLDPYSCEIAQSLGAEVLRRLVRHTWETAPGGPPAARAIRLPPELAAPPLVGMTMGVLVRGLPYWAMTGVPSVTSAGAAIQDLRQLALGEQT